VADDRAWGIVVEGHGKRYGRPIASKLGPVRFDMMAQAFGANGCRVDTAEDLAPAIRRGLEAPLPTLIHVPIAGSSPKGHSAA